MKNWLIVLIIFIAPLTLYGFLDSKDFYTDKVMAKNEAAKKISNNHLTVYKFYSALCKDCQKQAKEITMLKQENFKNVIFKDINVSGAQGESVQTQNLIDKYDVKVVPTIVIVNSKGKKLKKYDSVVSHNELKDILNELTGAK